MIKSQSSLVNKIYLYIDQKKEKIKSDNKYKKKKKIIKNKKRYIYEVVRYK